MAQATKRSAPQDTQVAKVMLLAAVFALLVIGLLMVYSATSATLSSRGASPYASVLGQIAYALIGIVGAVIIWRFIPYHAWVGSLTWIFWGVCMILLFLTFVMGTTVNGAKRWLYIGVIGMQPSEFVKIALLLMMVKIIYEIRYNRVDMRYIIGQIVLLIFAPLIFMYFTQSDLGTTLICAVGIFAVMWIGGVSKKVLIGIVVAAAIFVVIAVFGVGYRGSRFVYLDPWNDGDGGLGAGYNIIRSFFALAEGGLFGVGIGNSHEKYQYLFASDSDFIFAVIGEEMGLVGAMFVILLFLTVLFSGLRIAVNADDNLGAMLAGGCAIMLVFQAFLNIGCAIGVFPTTGKPLPFISSGGTSIISSFILVGIILSVERASETGLHEKRRDNLRVVRRVKK